MQKPSARQRKNLEKATNAYSQTLGLAIGYLAARGIERETAERARLGVVESPEPGHEHLSGRLAIPYMDKLGVYAIKFRCVIGHECKAEGCAKYLYLPGQETSMYNVCDTDSTRDTIHVAEGELDCLILTQIFPADPVCGIPGVTQWKEHAPFHFGGFERVLLWMDGDKAGRSLGDRIRRDVRAAEMVVIPDGLDVTDLYLQVGADVMRGMVGLDDDA